MILHYFSMMTEHFSDWTFLLFHVIHSHCALHYTVFGIVFRKYETNVAIRNVSMVQDMASITSHIYRTHGSLRGRIRGFFIQTFKHIEGLKVTVIGKEVGIKWRGLWHCWIFSRKYMWRLKTFLMCHVTFLINRKEFYRFYFSITELEGGKFD